MKKEAPMTAIEKALEKPHNLSKEEMAKLLGATQREEVEALSSAARELKRRIFGNRAAIRSTSSTLRL